MTLYPQEVDFRITECEAILDKFIMESILVNNRSFYHTNNMLSNTRWLYTVFGQTSSNFLFIFRSGDISK